MNWIFSQLVSKSVVSSRPLTGSDSFFDEEPLVEESDSQGETHPSTLVPEAVPQALLCPSDDNHERDLQTSSQQVIIDHSDNSHHDSNGKKADPLLKIEELQVKFSRILRRLGLPQNSLLVAKVLYRIHLATLIRADESDLKRINPRSDTARGKAEQQEALNQPELDFSIRILVLGKTGVGKSATINSIFDQTKTVTDPFRPATDRIQEIAGSINGLRLTIVDTPGFLPPSPINDKRNKKILLSVKRFIRKSPPDIVLYFDRLDLFGMGYNDAPLLKLITEVFGPGIWFNTVLVMTHSSSPLPEGLEGFPVNYESYVARCSDSAQRNIHQAVSDTKLENPVLLVENHPQCKRNSAGEKILPNGQVWRSEFLLLCICTKVLSDVNIILKLQKSIELGPPKPTRVPLLPHLLSSLLRHRQLVGPHGSDENEIDGSLFTESDLEEEDEYDQLLPIRILTKSQFQRLSKSQKKEYLDELDYRETLYLKKKLKEEYRTRREKKGKKAAADDHEEDDVSLPDVAIPASFDSNFPIHRYRAAAAPASGRWLVRPTLEAHGWDRDVGFDGISFETARETGPELLRASVAGQFSKDKQGFSVQSECAGSYSGPGPGRASYSAGLDVQSAGDDLMCTFRGGSRLRDVWRSTVDYGVSLTSFGDKCYFGAKIEDSVSVGKRLRFMANAGRLGGGEGRVAYGGNFEATLRGRDYPVRADSVSLLMTVLSLNKETVFGGNLKTEFRVNRGLKLSVDASLNTRKCGQICVKTSSSEHLHIALVAVFTMVKAISRRIGSQSLEEEY